MNIKIANRLVELRKKNNLSQEALAEKLGISRQAVSKWERAEASPDTDNLILLAKLYQVSLDDLLLRTEEEIPVFSSEMEDAETGKKEEQEISYKKGIPREEIVQREMEGNIIIEEKSKIDYGILRHFPAYAVAIFAFISLGALWNAWHPGWLLLLLPPIWQSAITALEKRDARRFAYPVLVSFIYLCMGFFYLLWHPGWLIFLTIPIYYSLVNYFRKLYKKQKKELDEILQGIQR